MHVLQVINGRITVKFCTRVAHDKPIPSTKQNSEISTDIDNDAIVLKFEFFVEKHSALKSCISVACGRNLAKIGRLTY